VGRQKEDAGEDGIMRVFMLITECKWEVRKMENGTFGTVVTNQKCIHSFLEETCRKWGTSKNWEYKGEYY